jgi:hypothetical protein
MEKSADKCSMQYRTFFCFVSSDALLKYTVVNEASPEDPSDGKRRPLCVAQAFRLSFALDPKLCIVGLGNPGTRGIGLFHWPTCCGTTVLYGAGLGIWLGRQPRST